MIRAFTFAALAGALIACTPKPAQEEAPPPPPPAAIFWEPGDTAGSSGLIWTNEEVMISLSCTQKCDPKAMPKEDPPELVCEPKGAVFGAAVSAPNGAGPAVGADVAVHLGEAVFTAKNLPLSDGTGDKVNLSLPLDAKIIAALDSATNARVSAGEFSVSGELDTENRFKQFAMSCKIHADAVK